MADTGFEIAAVGSAAPAYRAAGGDSSPRQLRTSGTEATPFGRIARQARAESEARAARARFFKASLFSDPAWDILLELFAAEAEGRRISISGVGIGANIPATTALRWINALEHEGLVKRRDDPLDRRRTFLSLTDKGVRAMAHYFESREKAFASL